MTEPSKDAPPATGFADPTRDIRLPPLPGRPVALPSQWQTAAPATGSSAAAPAAPAPEAPPAEPADSEAAAPPAPPADTPVVDAAQPTPATLISDQPTDDLVPPGKARHKTLTFGAGAPPAAVPPNLPLPRVVPSPPRSRRWPWVVLVALPLIVIAVAAVLLIVLLRGS